MKLNLINLSYFVQKHSKAIIIAWVAAILLLSVFSLRLFNVVSYNITGSNSSTSNTGGSQLLVINNNNVYSTASKALLFNISSTFGKNATTLYTIGFSVLNSTYYALVLEAKGLFSYFYSKYNVTPSTVSPILNYTIKSAVYSELLNKTLLEAAGGAFQSGSTLPSFINGVVENYQNETPDYIFYSNTFDEYPIKPNNATLYGFVNSAHTSTLVYLSNTPYKNASDFASAAGNGYNSTIYTTGADALSNGIESSTLSGTFVAILVGLLAAILITGFIFKSPITAFIPITIFGVDIGMAYALIYLIFKFVLNSTVSFFDPALTSILMLGISTDYLVYMLYRYRQGREEGLPYKRAAEIALTKAGKAILVSGTTVMGAYLVLYFLNLSFIGGTGLMNFIGIAAVLASALTLLPALVFTFGDRLFYPNNRRLFSKEDFLDKLSKFDNKHRRIIISLFIVIAIASLYVFFTVRPDFNFLGLLPQSGAKSAFYSAESSFGYDPIGPLMITFGNGTNSSAINSYASGINGVYAVEPLSHNASLVYLSSISFSAAALSTYNTLLDHIKNGGINASISGISAFLGDAYNGIASDIPVMIIALGVLIFAILFIILYSLYTPLRLVLMLVSVVMIANALTIAVFYFLLNLPFIIIAQVLLITNMMGVGVDYDIFLVIRMKENVKKGYKKAVELGLKKSGIVIVSIGAILAVMFFSLIASGIPILGEIGFIVGVGILIDTLLSILIIVPAMMFMLSRYNWWPSKE